MSVSYEQIRSENIERNNQFLKEIGLSTLQLRPVRLKRRSSGFEQPSRRSARLEELPPVEYKEVSFSQSTTKVHLLESRVEQKEEIPVRFNKGRAAVKQQGGSSGLVADIKLFLGDNLCKEVAEFGKTAVMAMANGGETPKFNKFSGAVEWLNSVFLWVNISEVGGAAEASNLTSFPNEFLQHGRQIVWFGGSRMRKDTPVIQRLCCSTALTPASPSTAECEDRLSFEEDTVLLFVRFSGACYACLGRLQIANCDLETHPIRFVFDLLDYDSLVNCDLFAKYVESCSSLS